MHWLPSLPLDGYIHVCKTLVDITKLTEATQQRLLVLLSFAESGIVVDVLIFIQDNDSVLERAQPDDTRGYFQPAFAFLKVTNRLQSLHKWINI